MPQLDQPWQALADALADPIAPIVLVVVIAVVVVRAIETLGHRFVEAIIEREAARAAPDMPPRPGTAEVGAGADLAVVEARKRLETLENLARQVIRIFVLLVASMMILAQLNVDIGPAIAGLGIAGIAVGFGAQSLVKDYFNGALIVAENQFSVGDVVTIAGVSGVVEEFSLRRTTLRDLSGVVHTVPNGEITVTSNRTRVWARINEDVSVAYETDIDRATAVVNRVGEDLARDPEWGQHILEPPAVLRVQLLGDYGVTLKILGTVRAPEQWSVAGELRKRLLASFAREGIEIPYPHRVVITRPDGPGAGPVRAGSADVARSPGVVAPREGGRPAVDPASANEA
jgi:small-conductance mechanosensitive channel